MATSQTDFIHNRYVVSECTLNLHYVGYFVSAEKIIKDISSKKIEKSSFFIYFF